MLYKHFVLIWCSSVFVGQYFSNVVFLFWWKDFNKSFCLWFWFWKDHSGISIFNAGFHFKIKTNSLIYNGLTSALVLLNFVIPFLWILFNCLKTGEPLNWGSFLLITLIFFSTHLIDLGKMKCWADLGAIKWFWTRDPRIGNLICDQ